MNPAGMFANTATITTRTWQTETNGSPVVSDSLAGSAFACSIQPKSSSEGVEFGRMSGTKQAVMYYMNQTLKHGDTLTSGGVTYKVVGPPRDAGGRGVFYSVDLEQEVSG